MLTEQCKECGGSYQKIEIEDGVCEGCRAKIEKARKEEEDGDEDMYDDTPIDYRPAPERGHGFYDR